MLSLRWSANSDRCPYAFGMNRQMHYVLKTPDFYRLRPVMPVFFIFPSIFCTFLDPILWSQYFTCNFIRKVAFLYIICLTGQVFGSSSRYWWRPDRHWSQAAEPLQIEHQIFWTITYPSAHIWGRFGLFMPFVQRFSWENVINCYINSNYFSTALQSGKWLISQQIFSNKCILMIVVCHFAVTDGEKETIQKRNV